MEAPHVAPVLLLHDVANRASAGFAVIHVDELLVFLPLGEYRVSLDLPVLVRLVGHAKAVGGRQGQAHGDVAVPETGGLLPLHVALVRMLLGRMVHEACAPLVAELVVQAQLSAKADAVDRDALVVVGRAAAQICSAEHQFRAEGDGQGVGDLERQVGRDGVGAQFRTIRLAAAGPVVAVLRAHAKAGEQPQADPGPFPGLMHEVGVGRGVDVGLGGGLAVAARAHVARGGDGREAEHDTGSRELGDAGRVVGHGRGVVSQGDVGSAHGVGAGAVLIQGETARLAESGQEHEQRQSPEAGG